MCYVECSHIFPPKFAAQESLNCAIGKTGELHWVQMNYLVHSLQMGDWPLNWYYILWAFLIAIPQFLFLFPQSIYAGIQIGLPDVNKMPIKLRPNW